MDCGVSARIARLGRADLPRKPACTTLWPCSLPEGRFFPSVPGDAVGDAASQDGFVFVFGGWNGEAQFNDLFMLDVENKACVKSEVPGCTSLSSGVPFSRTGRTLTSAGACRGGIWPHSLWKPSAKIQGCCIGFAGWSSSLVLQAIPSWRVFVFGGSADRMGRALRHEVLKSLSLVPFVQLVPVPTLPVAGEGRTMGSYDRKLGGL